MTTQDRFESRLEDLQMLIHNMEEPNRTEAYLRVYEWAHNEYHRFSNPAVNDPPEADE